MADLGAPAFVAAHQALDRSLAVPHVHIAGNSIGEGTGASGGNRDHGRNQKIAFALGAAAITKGGFAGAVMCHASHGGIGDGGVFWSIASMVPDVYFYGSNQVSNMAPNQYDKWGARKCIVLDDPWQNDIGTLGANTQPGIEAVRSRWAFASTCRFYHSVDFGNSQIPVSWSNTGTWAASTSAGTFVQSIGSGYQQSATAGSTFSIAMEPDMPAGRVMQDFFVVLPGDSAVVTISQVRSGSTIATKAFTINGAAQCDPANTGASFPGNLVVFRTGRPGDGFNWQAGDTKTIALTTLTAGYVRYNGHGVATDPRDGPIIHNFLPNYLPAPGYALYAQAGYAQGSAMSNAVIDVWVTAAQTLMGEFPGQAIGTNINGIISTATWPLGSFSNDGTVSSGAYSGQVGGIHPNADLHSQSAALGIVTILESGLLTARLCTAFNGPRNPVWYALGGGGAYGASSFLGTSFLSGWSQYGARYYSVQTYPGYYCDSAGVVRLKGKIVPPASGGSGVVAFQISQFGANAANKDFLVMAGIDDQWTAQGTATAGTFTLTVGGQMTAAIAYNATAAQVQSALGALSTVKSQNNVTVSGSLSAGFLITFNGELAGVAQAVTLNTGSLTGSATLTHTTTASVFQIQCKMTMQGSPLWGNAPSFVFYYSTVPSWVCLDGLNYPSET